MTLRNINTILFDWDMTLVNSFPAVEEALQEIEKHFGFSFGEIDMTKRFGMHFHDSLREIHAEHQGKLPEFPQFQDEYQKIFRARCADIELDAKETLKKIIDKGYRVGIVTYNSSEPVLKVLERQDFELSVVVGHEDMVDKAEGMLKALKELGALPKESAYVGDHSNDIFEARKAGLRPISVATGFLSKEELRKYEPDLVLDEVSELLKYI